MGTPLTLGNRVAFVSSTTGTGTYSGGSALDGYTTPAGAGIADGSRVPYIAVDNPNAPTIIEIGEGIYSAGSPFTLSRATIRMTLNAGVVGSSAINWPAGTRTILITPNVANIALKDTDGALRAKNTAAVWCSWNGSTINDSHNVASVTDHGTGDFTVVFADDMASANYVAGGWASVLSTDGSAITVQQRSDTSQRAAGSARFNASIDNGAGTRTLIDASFMDIVVFGVMA